MREKARGRLSLVLALVMVAVTGGAALAQQAAVPAATWQEVRRIPVPAEYARVACVELSPDGSHVAVVATQQSEAKDQQTTAYTKRTAIFLDGARFTEDF